MNTQRSLRIQVAIDQEIVAAGVTCLLGRHPHLLTETVEAVSLAQAEDAATGHCFEPWDLIVADHHHAVRLASAQRALRTRNERQARILVLTHLDREWDVRHAMDAGVHGYQLMSCSQEQLVDAVRTVAVGVRYIAVELASKLADSLSRDSLTSRELQVLAAMSTGASNKDISAMLGIADATVKAHVRAILSKFGACARTEAVAIAARRGLAGIQPWSMPAHTG